MPKKRNDGYPAFHGRVVFHCTEETLASTAQARKLYAGLRPVAGSEFLSDASDFVVLLANTDNVEVSHEEDHASLQTLHDFWVWWQTGPAEVDYAELWAWRMKLSQAVIREWLAAFNSQQLTALGPLAAPRELVPESELTPEELADPN